MGVSHLLRLYFDVFQNSVAFMISHQNELKVPPAGGYRFSVCISDLEVVIVVIELNLEDELDEMVPDLVPLPD